MNKPMGVSTYQLIHALPDQMKGSLPTIAELEKELETGKERGGILAEGASG